MLFTFCIGNLANKDDNNLRLYHRRIRCMQMIVSLLSPSKRYVYIAFKLIKLLDFERRR